MSPRNIQSIRSVKPYNDTAFIHGNYNRKIVAVGKKKTIAIVMLIFVIRISGDHILYYPIFRPIAANSYMHHCLKRFHRIVKCHMKMCVLGFFRSNSGALNCIFEQLNGPTENGLSANNILTANMNFEFPDGTRGGMVIPKFIDGLIGNGDDAVAEVQHALEGAHFFVALALVTAGSLAYLSFKIATFKRVQGPTARARVRPEKLDSGHNRPELLAADSVVDQWLAVITEGVKAGPFLRGAAVNVGPRALLAVAGRSAAQDVGMTMFRVSNFNHDVGGLAVGVGVEAENGGGGGHELCASGGHGAILLLGPGTAAGPSL
ncbi:hypothetical protein CHU95_19930 [Niveispirillum lacus]|uniref:Uncharacterized protein n=1 Tax=Niveispirillum lacus TaxID=1981099 RepID=A0A255YQB6_9PROT|nr:hypothetical protein CHU95_19930 [Niveispirillum lacus]